MQKREQMYYFFRICVLFLEWLGKTFHVTYQQISVYTNLYLQGGILVFSTIPAFTIAIVNRNLLWIIICSLYLLLYLLGFVWMLVHYRLPGNVMYAFEQCVNDLLFLAQKLHVTYQQMNIIIFVILFLVLIMVNVVLCFLI